MAGNARYPMVDPNDLFLRRIALLLIEAVDQRYGPESTFEQMCDYRFELARGFLWLAEELELQRRVTNAKEVGVDGQRY